MNKLKKANKKNEKTVVSGYKAIRKKLMRILVFFGVMAVGCATVENNNNLLNGNWKRYSVLGYAVRFDRDVIYYIYNNEIAANSRDFSSSNIYGTFKVRGSTIIVTRPDGNIERITFEMPDDRTLFLNGDFITGNYRKY